MKPKIEEYPAIFRALEGNKDRVAHLRNLCRTDLYFLLRYACGLAFIEHPFFFARCREVEQNPDGHLDLWARGHGKSLIITFGKTIQDILITHGEGAVGEELAAAIFSFNRPGAKKHFRLIKEELTTNERLKEWFPDILWADPEKEAPVWSLDDGIVVRRKSNRREQTVEAWGLIDAMPTGSHFNLRVYDDVITERYARSPDMVLKSIESWELSLNLGSLHTNRERYIGTRYAFADAYKAIMDRDAAKPRLYPATVDGTVDGDPVLLPADELVKKRRQMGSYTFAAQMLLNPVADEKQGFRRDWLRYVDEMPTGAGLNIYIIVDPANEKKKKSDYTAIVVLGLGPDENVYVLDIVRDRLNLHERTAELMRLHRKWRTRANAKPFRVAYERYGKDSDIQHIQYVQGQENYRFDIEEVGGQMAKNDRIRRLIPIMQEGRFYLPQTLLRADADGKTVDLIESFIHNELEPFPVGEHDDILDAISRLWDLEIVWPQVHDAEKYRPKLNTSRSWMAR